jgi:cytochrome o ubiquinol oxidase subunit 2
MNSFFIPQLGSQIYAMAGMQTQLHLIAGKAGSYDGLSANFSGDGFSDMHFKAIATSNEQFQAWVRSVRQSHDRLDPADYARIAAPSEKNPVAFFSRVKPRLYDDIIAKYRGKAMALHSGMKED